jgi:hypothetical protein
MTAAPRRRSLAGPATKGAGEGAQLRILQGGRDLTERHVSRHQQFTSDLEADFVGDLTKCNPFRPQMSV